MSIPGIISLGVFVGFVRTDRKLLIRIPDFSGLVASSKKMKFRTGLRTASKVQEKQLISTGKWLADHPDVITPQTDCENRRCNFSSILSKISLAAENKDDQNLLRKLAKRGDHLARAYAATILMAKEERAPYLAVARGSEGDVAYAYSPKVKRETLIGLQYFKDPHLRLLAYAHLSRKRKVAFYSTKDAVFCSLAEGNPPLKFVEEIAQRLHLSSKGKSTYSCGHNLEENGYLRIGWNSSEVSLMICEKCFAEGVSSVSKIVERMVTPRINETFSLKAFVRLECRGKCDKCSTGNMYEYDSDDKNSYISGQMTDEQIYEKAVERFLKSIQEDEKSLLVVGTRCFGNDAEKEAVEFVLSKLEGTVVVPGNMTTNKFLAQNWGRFGSDLMSKFAGTPTGEAAPEPAGNVTPMMLIERAQAKRKADTVKDALPHYRQMGKHATFIDSIVRVYKSKGIDAALKLTELAGTEDTHYKSTGLAFRIAFGVTGLEWQYTREEIDLAKHLAAPAKTLLVAEGEEYDVLFRQFARNAGIQDEIVRTK
jgi:hypothetical protein